MAGNDAIHANPDNVDQIKLTVRGSDWLWAVFAVMLLTDIGVFVWHLMIPRGQRVFHQLAIIILTTASIAYFCMAGALGYASIATEFAGEGYPAGALREIWYVRYIDWTITTPALLLELVLASGLPLSDILTLVFFDLVMIETGLVGALIVSSYKFGLFCVACVAMFYIFWVLAFPARQSAGALGAEYKKSFTISAGILAVLWTLYPVAWGLADGGNVISPDGEMIFYGILDLLAKPVFCIVHLVLLSKLDLTALQLQSGKFSTSAQEVSSYDREKHSSRHHHQPTVTAVDNPPRQPMDHLPATSTPKKKTFSRKGKYDAAPVATTGTNNVFTSNINNGTRPSESTATSG